MNRNLIKQWIPRMLVVATLAATGAVIAAEQGGPMMGGGMMDMMMGGGTGGGMGTMGMGGSGGMMGGGMMGGMGMGPGGGMGMGMMGMGGPGMGMMGMGPVSMLDLSDEQRDKIGKLSDDVRRKNWDTYGKIMDEQAKLRDLYSDETVDVRKAGAVYGNISKLQQQVFETNLETRNRVQAVLTKEQKEQLRQMSRGGMGMGRGMTGSTGQGGYGPGNMPRGGMGMGPGMMNR
jgi:Spy/CpxP family protein refolding chaperone